MVPAWCSVRAGHRAGSRGPSSACRGAFWRRSPRSSRGARPRAGVPRPRRASRSARRRRARRAPAGDRSSSETRRRPARCARPPRRTTRDGGEGLSSGAESDRAGASRKLSHERVSSTTFVATEANSKSSRAGTPSGGAGRQHRRAVAVQPLHARVGRGLGLVGEDEVDERLLPVAPRRARGSCGVRSRRSTADALRLAAGRAGAVGPHLEVLGQVGEPRDRREEVAPTPLSRP